MNEYDHKGADYQAEDQGVLHGPGNKQDQYCKGIETKDESDKEKQVALNNMVEWECGYADGSQEYIGCREPDEPPEFLNFFTFYRRMIFTGIIDQALYREKEPAEYGQVYSMSPRTYAIVSVEKYQQDPRNGSEKAKETEC